MMMAIQSQRSQSSSRLHKQFINTSGGRRFEGRFAALVLVYEVGANVCPKFARAKRGRREANRKAVSERMICAGFGTRNERMGVKGEQKIFLAIGRSVLLCRAKSKTGKRCEPFPGRGSID